MDIKKGQIGNALESVAPDHVVAEAKDIYDNTLNKYQTEVNAGKQDKLVSGTNIKTINGESILGSGNISIQGGGGGGGTVNGVKVGSNATVYPDAQGVVNIPNYTENATPHVAPTETEVKNALGTSSTHGGAFLRKDGTWQIPTNTEYGEATTSNAGLMSASDKAKLNGIENGAQVHIPPTLSEVKTALGAGSGTVKYLREDGTWQTPPEWGGNTPDTEVIVIDVPTASQSDIATYLLQNVPAAQRANNIFRVPGPSNNSFSEWGWNGTAFVMLDEKNYGVDDTPNAASQNVVNSKGIYKFVAEEALFRITDFSIQSGANGIKSVKSFKWDGRRFCGYVVNNAADNREYRIMIYQYDINYNLLEYGVVWSPFAVIDKPVTNAVYFDLRVAKRNASNTGYEAITQEDISHIEVYSNYPEYYNSAGKNENSVFVIPDSRVQNGTSLESSTTLGVIVILANVVSTLDGGTHHQIRNYLVQGYDSSGLYFSGIFDKAGYLNLDNPSADTNYYNLAVVGKNGEVVYRGRLIGRNTIYVPTGYTLYMTAENIEYGKIYEPIKREIISLNRTTPLATSINVTMNNGKWIKEGANGNVLDENFNEYKYALNYKVTQDGWIGGVFGNGLIRCNFMVTSSLAANAILEKYILSGLQFIRVYKGDEMTFAMPATSTPLFIPNYDKDYIAQVSYDGLAALSDRENANILYDSSRFTLSSNTSACESVDLFRFCNKPAKCYCIDLANSGALYKMNVIKFDDDKNVIGYDSWQNFGCIAAPIQDAVYYSIQIAKVVNGSYTLVTRENLDNLLVYVDRLPDCRYMENINQGKRFILTGSPRFMQTTSYCKWEECKIDIIPYHKNGRVVRAMIEQYDKDFNVLGYRNIWSEHFSDTPLENAVYFSIRISKRNAGNTDYEAMTDEDIQNVMVFCNYTPADNNITINMLGDSMTEQGHITSALSAHGYHINNYGVSGTTIAGGGQSFINRYSSMTNDCDMVLVIGGCNDWRAGIPLGSFEDGAGTNTFYGALHTLLAGLKDKYTNVDSNKIIVFGTPLHNQFYWPDDTYPDIPEYVVENGKIVPQDYGGGILKQYVNAIKEVCEYYAIPVIDLYARCFLAPIQQANFDKYTKDGLHPNVAGGKLIAEAIIREIKNFK